MDDGRTRPVNLGRAVLQPRVPRVDPSGRVLDSRDATRLLAARTTRGLSSDVSADDLSIWLHFDAKYRVEYADQQFSEPHADDGELAADAEMTERLARSKREDLLKMHAYRDAIRRSAGAYVLYPGEHHQQPFVEHHEVLPGLGAFVLRPRDGGTVGTDALEQFLARSSRPRRRSGDPT